MQKYSHCEVLQGKWYQIVNKLCAHQFKNLKFPTTHRIKNTRKTPEYYGGVIVVNYENLSEIMRRIVDMIFCVIIVSIIEEKIT